MTEERSGYRKAANASTLIGSRSFRSVLPVTPVKYKASGQIICPIAPANVLEGCTAEFNLSVDKFQYHVPLYGQHQRMLQSGNKISRSSLTNWVKAPSSC